MFSLQPLIGCVFALSGTSKCTAFHLQARPKLLQACRATPNVPSPLQRRLGRRYRLRRRLEIRANPVWPCQLTIRVLLKLYTRIAQKKKTDFRPWVARTGHEAGNTNSLDHVLPTFHAGFLMYSHVLSLLGWSRCDSSACVPLATPNRAGRICIVRNPLTPYRRPSRLPGFCAYEKRSRPQPTGPLFLRSFGPDP